MDDSAPYSEDDFTIPLWGRLHGVYMDPVVKRIEIYTHNMVMLDRYWQVWYNGNLALHNEYPTDEEIRSFRRRIDNLPKRTPI